MISLKTVDRWFFRRRTSVGHPLLCDMRMSEIIRKIQQLSRGCVSETKKSRAEIFRGERTHFFLQRAWVNYDKDNVLLSGTIRSRRYANDSYLGSTRKYKNASNFYSSSMTCENVWQGLLLASTSDMYSFPLFVRGLVSISVRNNCANIDSSKIKIAVPSKRRVVLRTAG